MNQSVNNVNISEMMQALMQGGSSVRTKNDEQVEDLKKQLDDKQQIID